MLEDDLRKYESKLKKNKNSKTARKTLKYLADLASIELPENITLHEVIDFAIKVRRFYKNLIPAKSSKNIYEFKDELYQLSEKVLLVLAIEYSPPPRGSELPDFTRPGA